LDAQMHTQTDESTDTQVILYSVQCYALHWTDNNKKHMSQNLTFDFCLTGQFIWTN